MSGRSSHSSSISLSNSLTWLSGTMHVHARTHTHTHIHTHQLLLVHTVMSRGYPPHSVSDADGQFLLIEAAQHIPKWLNPDSACNRVSLDLAGTLLQQ